MKTVLITGAGGFIARHVARSLRAAGCRVIGVARGIVSDGDYGAVHRASLTKSLEPVFAAEYVDVVVHTANHAGKDEYRINVEGTERWLEEGEAHGVKLQVFLSSLSASARAVAAYGKAKYDLEARFTRQNHVALRLGVVVGDGGMFERIRRSLERAWLVPLLDGGRSVVYVVGIEELSCIIRDVVLNDSPDMRGSVWNVQQPDSHTLRQLMEEIRRVFGYRCRFVPIPSLPVLWGVMAAEAVPGLRLPISSTNIRGLRQSRHETHRSDFARFGYPERSLEELIEGVKQFTG